VDTVIRAIAAVSAAARNAENAEAKKDQSESFSNESVPVILDPDGNDPWLDLGMKGRECSVRSVEALRRPADAQRPR
jgi:hypothetical protein